MAVNKEILVSLSAKWQARVDLLKIDLAAEEKEENESEFHIDGEMSIAEHVLHHEIHQLERCIKELGECLK
jgi:hypothetical protein